MRRHETNEVAFGLAVCALDLMARAGEVIEDMQVKGELRTQKDGRPSKASQVATLTDLLVGGKGGLEHNLILGQLDNCTKEMAKWMGVK
jgi:hypothetical protein